MNLFEFKCDAGALCRYVLFTDLHVSAWCYTEGKIKKMQKPLSSNVNYQGP